MKFFIKTSFSFRFFSVAALISFLSVVIFWGGMNSIFESQRKKEFKGDQFFYSYAETLKELHKKTGADYHLLVQVFNEKNFLPQHPQFILMPKGAKPVGKRQEPEKDSHLFPPPEPPMMSFPLDEQYDIHLAPPNMNEKRPLLPPHLFFLFSLGLMFFVVLLVVSTSALILLYFWKKQGRQASEVIAALKSGNLKARIPVSSIQPLSSLVAEFNAMADEIEDLVSLLRNTDEYRRKMLQELAHDLRTPIASMKTLLETIRDNEDKLPSHEKKNF